MQKIISDKRFLLGLGIVLILSLITFSIVKTYSFIKQKQMNKNKNIDIVFNTDYTYKEPTKVAIKSAIVNKNEDTIYNINVLCVELTEAQCSEFNVFKGDKVNINTIHLNLDELDNINDYKIAHHVTRADLFKFLMPDIFKDLDKILYIDSDTLIRKDLAEIYNTNIGNHYLGAVRKYQNPKITMPIFSYSNISFYMDVELTEYNCGVLLFNLKKLRKDNIKEKLIDAKNKDTLRKLQTQTAYNEVIPYKKSYKLSPLYNAISRWESVDFYLLDFKKMYRPYLNKIDTMQELYNKAVIVHYAGEAKPWNNEYVRFFDEWWQYAKMINPNWKFTPKSKNK